MGIEVAKVHKVAQTGVEAAAQSIMRADSLDAARHSFGDSGLIKLARSNSIRVARTPSA